MDVTVSVYGNLKETTVIASSAIEWFIKGASTTKSWIWQFITAFARFA